MADDSADELSWETLDSTIVHENPGFAVRRDDVRLPDGTESEYHYVDEPGAVVVLPFTPEGDVVVIEEWRQAVDRVNRGLPAGSVERDDEDLTEAAARELAEETGYEADSFDHLCTVEPSNGVLGSIHHHFVARGCRQTAQQDLDADESIRVETTSYDELLQAVLDGEIWDGRTALALLRYELGSGRDDELP